MEGGGGDGGKIRPFDSQLMMNMAACLDCTLFGLEASCFCSGKNAWINGGGGGSDALQSCEIEALSEDWRMMLHSGCRSKAVSPKDVLMREGC